MFEIRNAVPEDITEIMKVEEASFIPEIQESPEVFEQRIKMFGDGFLIFESKTKSEKSSENAAGVKCAGYFCGELWNDYEDKARFGLGHDIVKVLDKHGKFFYISSFAIMPEFRGNGSGKSALNECMKYIEEKFPQVQIVVLMVNEIWKGAEHIYRTAGFNEVFRIPGIFPAESGRKNDGIIMVKNLQE